MDAHTNRCEVDGALDQPIANAENLELIMRYVRLSRSMKDEIKLYMKHDTSHPPSCLPQHIEKFMQRALKFDDDQVKLWWETLKEIVWVDYAQPLTSDDISAFQRYGPQTGIGVHVRTDSAKLKNISHKIFYPPFFICPHCSHRLTEALHYESVLFTLWEGAVATYCTSMYCRRKECPAQNTRYYPNYSVRESNDQLIRTYYSGIPEFIQFEEHFFIEAKLCEYFANEMLLTWSSASNCGNLYNLTISDPTHFRPTYPASWPNRFELTGRKVWHVFQLHALICDWARRNKILEVPHSCTLDEQLSTAIQERNRLVCTIGDLSAMTHVCDLCCKYITGDGFNSLSRLDAVIMDGVTLGHACCGIMHCRNPLRTKHERFCHIHTKEDKLCRIKGCSNAVQGQYRSCADPAHRALDLANKEKGQSFFQLSQHLQRAHISHLTNAVSVDATVNVDDADSDIDDQVSRRALQVMKDSEVACDGKSDTGNVKLRAQWNRKQTHNEQLIVRPCGVIVARRTMYGSEGKAEAKDILKDVFKDPKHLLSVIFYDNNCQLLQHIRSSPKDIEFFKDVIMLVDVFHFKSKHKVTDEFCQHHCNPALWPELYADGKWVFNSSVAEQTNAWIGGYHAMLREMNVDHYGFFLDEMIHRRNDLIVAKLYKDGHAPFNYMDL